MPRNITTEIILNRFKKKWGTNYDYSNVVYIDSRTEVEIICHKEGHGSFLQLPSVHGKGHGCWKCGDKKRGQQQVLSKVWNKKIFKKIQEGVEGVEK